MNFHRRSGCKRSNLLGSEVAFSPEHCGLAADQGVLHLLPGRRSSSSLRCLGGDGRFSGTAGATPARVRRNMYAGAAPAVLHPAPTISGKTRGQRTRGQRPLRTAARARGGAAPCAREWTGRQGGGGGRAWGRVSDRLVRDPLLGLLALGRAPATSGIRSLSAQATHALEAWPVQATREVWRRL